MTDHTNYTSRRTTTTYLKTLVKEVGVEKAADLVGLAKNSVYKSVQTGTTSKTAEIAAKLQLEKLEQRKTGTASAPRRNRLCIIKMTPTQYDMFKPLFDTTGVRVAFADED